MPSNSAAMPPSRFDNQNGNFLQGGYGTNARHSNPRNDGGAADQITPEHIADFVGLAYHKFDAGDQDQLCALLQDIVDAHNGNGGAATDQEGSALRLPQGWGSNGAALTAREQGNAGSGSARREAWTNITDPPATDRQRLGAGRNWPTGDRRRPAQDSARRAQQMDAFFDRFPGARLIQVW